MTLGLERLLSQAPSAEVPIKQSYEFSKAPLVKLLIISKIILDAIARNTLSPLHNEEP